MIFSPLEEKRTFLEHLSKKNLIISFLILFLLLIWAILIQTSFKTSDERTIYTFSEVNQLEFEVDLSYISRYAKDSKKEKIIRLYSQFDLVINPDDERIFLSISRDSKKNPQNN